jgi:cation-transporting P-type ATPase 13A2
MTDITGNGNVHLCIPQERDVIEEVDGNTAKITGYCYSRVRAWLTYIGYVFTLGIMRLVFHWVPSWHLQVQYQPSSLQHADKVLIEDKYKQRFVHEVVRCDKANSRLACAPELYKAPIRKLTNHAAKTNGNEPFIESPFLSNGVIGNMVPYFYYKKLKYVWNAETLTFELLCGFDKQMICSQFHQCQPLTASEVSHKQHLYGHNEIIIRVTPISELLLNEGLNPFYMFQVASCILWFCDDYWMYASCIIVLSAMALSWELYELRKSELSLSKTVYSTGNARVCRNNQGLYEEVDCSVLVPGDIIEIPRGGCMMHCDAVLISGNCIVNESMLTGESVPITKTPLPNVKVPKAGKSSESSAAFIGTDMPFNINSHSRHVLFCGTRVIQTRTYPGDTVRAVVCRTGFSTAKGELVRSILFPKPVEFKFNQDAMRFIIMLTFLALVGFTFTVYMMMSRGETYRAIILRALDLITIVVPPALPVAMTVGTVFAQRRLKNQMIFCISPNAINVCGVINVVCFDKTGTLTEEGLDLWGVVPLEKNGQFGVAIRDPGELPTSFPLIVQCMATCHSLTRIDGVLSGDPLDLIMFQSLQWDLLEPGSNGEDSEEDYHKFGMAVPTIVRPLPNASENQVTKTTAPFQGTNSEIGILKQFPFSSSLQRMSVIVRLIGADSFTLYVKGSPEKVQQLCRPDTMPRNYHHTLLYYTREGYRVLALAWRPLKISYSKMHRVQREQVECDLRFLGLLVLENRLKPESAPAIETLKNANIRTIMVTGDNMLTALSVARDCDMIEEFEKIIVVDANPPKTAYARAAGLILPTIGNGSAKHNGNITIPITSSTPNMNSMQSEIRKPLNISPSAIDMEHLVEFHYAEDLQKMVTEVTAAKLQKHLRRRHKKHQPLEAGAGLSSGTGRPSPNVTPNRLAIPELTLHVMDRPDFHLAMSGKTWSVIQQHCPHLIPKLLVKGTVFARFSPDQKAQLIESLQSLGYFVAMCGDGANDCGALKAAHAGISLSEAEASVASPFTSKRQNISCIPDLIREGRCALSTSFGIFKFMAGYSLIQFVSVLLLYMVGLNLFDLQFLFIDMIIITSLGATFSYAHSHPRLSMEPPSVHLVSLNTVLSLLLQVVLVIIFQSIAYFYIAKQVWFLPYESEGEDDMSACFENTGVFLLSSFQYIIIAVVFSKGAPYRQSILHNPAFLVNIVILVSFTIYLSLRPAMWLLKLFDLVYYPSWMIHLIFLSFVVSNFLSAYLVELAVDGVATARRIRRIKRALFPKMFSHKEYERIRDEIDRNTAHWPPLTRSASVQDIRPEIFSEFPSGEQDQLLHRSQSVDANAMQQFCQRPKLHDSLLAKTCDENEDDNEEAGHSGMIS